jgi:hypothetical protein
MRYTRKSGAGIGRNAKACAALARVTGLEPATSGVTGRRSNQLSYTRSRPQRLEAGGMLVKASRLRIGQLKFGGR